MGGWVGEREGERERRCEGERKRGREGEEGEEEKQKCAVCV